MLNEPAAKAKVGHLVARCAELRSYGAADVMGKCPFEQAGSRAVRFQMCAVEHHCLEVPASAASAMNIQSNTPSLLQRTKRLYNVLCRP